ncbi:nuclear transport factor 2A-like [Hibiscus syriacus]|uniref:nuclear transport factor 2A-like n=1 Tax=Hibiscus syriacus TaxID=106335 RepID=UPI001922F780|nr:nuclear transport factor 2A-like [Hibiscus syriacus]
MTCVTTVTTQVLWNGVVTESFKPSRGIGQGDPLAPYIFVLCMERLSHAINRRVDSGSLSFLEATIQILIKKRKFRWIQGSQNIVAKLTGLPFQQCKHNITTVDCQPSGAGGVLVFVSGTLQLAGEQHALKFSQMFHLMPTPQGSFYVLNDIFRLNYA